MSEHIQHGSEGPSLTQGFIAPELSLQALEKTRERIKLTYSTVESSPIYLQFHSPSVFILTIYQESQNQQSKDDLHCILAPQDQYQKAAVFRMDS